VAAAAATPTFRVESPADGRPHRVSVVGVAPATLARLQAFGPERVGDLLAVYTEAARAGAGLPAVAGVHVVDADGIHFSPRFPFVPGMGYSARFEVDGVRLEHRFTVGAPGTDPPRVVAVYPSGGALPENALRLYVHFSRPMNTKDSQRHVRLLEAEGAEIPLAFVEVANGLWDPGQTRLTLFFHPGRVKRGVAPGERLGPVLRDGRRYRLQVGAGLSDTAGVPLGTPYEWTFTAGPADRTGPRADAVQVDEAASGTVTLRLPEPLDHALLQRWVWVQDERGRPLEGLAAVSGGETRWSFTPARGWPAGRSVLCLQPALEDRAGNRFDRPFDREPGTRRAPPATPFCLTLSARP
jgi:hypothetical protein